MYIAYRWRDRVLGRGELVIAVILISLLLALLIDKTLELFSLTEEQLILTSITSMNTSLQLYSTLVAAGLIEKELSEQINPIVLVQSSSVDENIDSSNSYIGVAAQFKQSSPLTNYLGEFANPGY